MPTQGQLDFFMIFLKPKAVNVPFRASRGLSGRKNAPFIPRKGIKEAFFREKAGNTAVKKLHFCIN
jgi:hypothetical protein